MLSSLKRRFICWKQTLAVGMESLWSEFPMSAHPKTGEKGGCPYSSQQPFDAVPRQVVSFGDTDAVEYQDYEASFNPLKPFHALRSAHNSYQVRTREIAVSQRGSNDRR
jgi:hypothetical protein